MWNGKEALEYLLKEDSPEHPQPDIILMDVQMPIMDGYRATHTIRHRQPYANQVRLRGIPIVAMTASAIQGDREKCKRAGMDDYLAKPVQGKILEKMLVKWSIEARKDRRNVEYYQDTTNSSVTDEQSNSPVEEPVAMPAPPVVKATGVGKGTSKSGTRGYRDAADTRHQRSVFTNESAFAARSSETENASVARRVAAEEKAISLRDDKLLSMASSPGRPPLKSGKSHHADATGPSHALTRENIDIFEHQQEQVGTSDDNDSAKPDIATSSLAIESATSMMNVSRAPPPEADSGLKPPLVTRSTTIGPAAKQDNDKSITSHAN